MSFTCLASVLTSWMEVWSQRAIDESITAKFWVLLIRCSVLKKEKPRIRNSENEILDKIS